MRRGIWVDRSGLFGLLAAIVVAAPPALAQDVRSACRFDLIAIGKVAAVLDGRSFTLDDGREVRLAGIEAPPASKAALESLVVGRNVELRGAGVADRYSRTVAHVFIAGDGGSFSIARQMLTNGHARLGVHIGHAACTAELRSAERAARTQKVGLWSESLYGIVEAESLGDLLAGRGRFTVVEGKVVSVRESGGTIYVNFGRRWSQALTVTILKRHERIFTAAGLAPKTLANRRVRVRGWVEDRNGPRIDATRPEQIELAELN